MFALSAPITHPPADQLPPCVVVIIPAECSSRTPTTGPAPQEPTNSWPNTSPATPRPDQIQARKASLTCPQCMPAKLPAPCGTPAHPRHSSQTLAQPRRLTRRPTARHTVVIPGIDWSSCPGIPRTWSIPSGTLSPPCLESATDTQLSGSAPCPRRTSAKQFMSYRVDASDHSLSLSCTRFCSIGTARQHAVDIPG